MKRNKKEEFYKAYLRRVDEYHENHNAQRALGYKPLDKPIHYGYEVYYTLRDDITRRQDADIIQRLVDDYTIPMWCENPDSTTRRRYRRRGEGKFYEVKPEWRHVPTYRWDRVPKDLQKWFELQESHYSWGVPYFHWKVFIPPFWLEKKVRKYYKTHYKVVDEILKQEEAEIRADLWGKYYDYWVSGWSEPSKWYRKHTHKAKRRTNKLKLKKAIMDDTLDEFIDFDRLRNDWW